MREASFSARGDLDKLEIVGNEDLLRFSSEVDDVLRWLCQHIHFWATENTSTISKATRNITDIDAYDPP